MTAIESRYQVVAHLARGGMAEILLARRLGPAKFEKLVVLKRPLQVAGGSREIVEALLDEARLLARINHMNVCQVHDLEEADGQFYLALEYLEGLSLWALIASAEHAKQPMDPRAVCGIIAQACDGLDAIHALRGHDGKLAGVVHRDISPSNLFLIDNGTVKILDLGIAKASDSEDRTPFGRVKGKMPYIAPEQARGRAVDARADLFALGLVLYDLVRSVRPGDRIGAIACESLMLDDVPPPIASVVRIATAVDPAARFATAADLGHAVRHAGAALGGWFDRGELARWLAEHFANDITARQTWLAGTSLPEATGTATQILTLRSALVLDDATAAPRSRETERLDVPAYERPTLRHARRRWGLAAVGLGVIVAAVAVVFVMANRDEPPPASVAEAPAAVAESLAAPRSPPPISPVGANPITAAPKPSTPLPATPKPSTPPPVRPPRTQRAQPPASGSLTVESAPWAWVSLENENTREQTTVYRHPLTAGRHLLHATTADGRSQDVVVVIEPGRERRMWLHWGSK